MTSPLPLVATTPVFRKTLLVFGLGNTSHPQTRHNVGMMALDAIVGKQTLLRGTLTDPLGWTMKKSIPAHIAGWKLTKSDFPVAKRKKGGLKGINEPKPVGTEDDVVSEWEANVVFVKVKGFMNMSGVGVACAAREYKVKPADILVLHDELEKKVGSVAFKASGSAGGHNGLRSIQSTLHTDSFGRLRIGIDRPSSKDAVARYVLEKFHLDEQEILEETVYTKVEEMMGDWVKARMERAEAGTTQSPQKKLI